MQSVAWLVCDFLIYTKQKNLKQVRPSSMMAVYQHMPILRPHAAQTW